MTGESILVVEDEAMVAEDIRLHLQDAGYHVVAAVPSGEEAINLIQQAHVDAIMMDIVLGGAMDGIQAAARIHEHSDVPVIYLTAYTDRETLERAQQTAPYGYLVKPFDERELRTTVEMALYRNEMERKLREREKWARDVLRSIGDGVITTDRQGRVTYLNPAAESLSGWDSAQALGQPLSDVVRLSDQSGGAVAQSPIEQALQGDLVTYTGSYLMRPRDGGTVPIDATIAANRDERNVFDGLNVTFRDVTERVEAQKLLRQSNEALEARVEERTRELEQAKRAAEHASDVKSQFLARMSHELRTPLNSVLGFAQTLDSEAATSKHPVQQRAVRHILRSGWHLLDLINDLLDFSRLEENKLEVARENVALGGIIEDSVTMIRPLATERAVAVSVSSLAGRAGCVQADRIRLKQVLLNLLSNAVKFSREGGEVNVVVANASAGRLRISVADTGPGIAAQDLSELFEPFSQLYLKTFAQEGTGVGLVLVKRLITLMGGTVGVASEPGVGSTFWIELAGCNAEQAALESVPRHRAGPAADEAATVLYIDDTPSHINLVQEILEQRYPTVRMFSAHLPQIGIDLAQAHRPDLILLDISLPGMDGYEVLRQLRASEATSAIPVVALSANALPDDIQRGLGSGFAAYVTKPLLVQEFCRVLAELLPAAAVPDSTA